MSVFAVELADLRGYANLVDRAGANATELGAESDAGITDGNFGKILEMITGDYEALLPSFHAILKEDGVRLDQTGNALRSLATDFAGTDAQVAHRFGHGHVTSDHDASAFGDVAPLTMACPSVSQASLPQVHFGFPWDQACDILGHIGFPDPREYVTAWIVGDVGKAEMQAGYWDMIGTNMSNVHSNLAHGAGQIGHTWEGQAATQHAVVIRQWLSSLDDQSRGMKDMSGHLRDMVGEALDMAQMVIDTVKFVVSTLAAGWSCAYIPIYGEIKIVEKVKDTWHLINNARKVISVFWSFLTVMKDAIMGIVDVFSATSLPDAPVVP